MNYIKLNFLYYNKQKTTSKFTNQYTGTLSIDQLLKNSPCWEDITKSTIKVKKTLIIMFFENSIYMPWYFALHNLLKDGFDIYAVLNKELCKINNTEQINDDFINSITFLCKSDLLPLLKKNNLLFEQVQVIEQWHWKLLSTNEMVSDTDILNSSLNFREYFDPEHLECDLYFKSNDEKAIKTIESCLKYSIETKNSLRLSTDSLACNILLRNEKNLNVIKKIRKLYITHLKTESDASRLVTILKKFPSLESLHFIECDKLDIFFEMANEDSYKEIKTLNIKQCQSFNITKLLQNAKHLSELHINQSIFYIDTDINSLAIPNLKTINFEGINNESLKLVPLILSVAKNIEHINIVTNITLTRIDIFLPGISFNNLTSFNCPSFCDNISDIPNYEMLQRISIAQTVNNISSSSTANKNLTTIKIQLDSFSSNIINHACNINYLRLNNVEDLTSVIIPNNGFPKLTNIFISFKNNNNSDKNIIHLNSILKAAPNCNIITINSLIFNSDAKLLIPYDAISVHFSNCLFERADCIDWNHINRLTMNKCTYYFDKDTNNVIADYKSCTVQTIEFISCRTAGNKEHITSKMPLFLNKIKKLNNIIFKAPFYKEDINRNFTFFYLLNDYTGESIQKLLIETGIREYYSRLYKFKDKIEKGFDNKYHLDYTVNYSENKSHIVRRIFTLLDTDNEQANPTNPKISPHFYRVGVCKNYNFKDKNNNPTIEFFNSELNLENIPTSSQYNEVNIYEANIEVNANNTWQELSSLSPHDYLSSITIADEGLSYELKYSKALNQYFIKFPLIFRKVAIKYTIHTPKNALNNLSIKIPTQVNELLKKYQQYGTGSFNNDDYSSAERYLHAIQNKRIGSCRHRVLGFVNELSLSMPEIQYRIIYNDCHAFVELYINDLWHKFDLGGWSANLVIQETTKNIAPSNFIPVKVDFNPIFNTWDLNNSSTNKQKTYEDHLNYIKNISNKRILIQIDSANHTILDFVSSLSDTRIPLYFINSIEDLICSAPFITIDQNNHGIINNGPGGKLHNFLIQNKNNKIIIIANTENFKNDELNTITDAFDSKKIDGTPLPDDTLLILLSNSALSTKEEMLSSHVDEIINFRNLEILAPSNIILNDESIHTSSTLVTLQKLEINLYNSINWHSLLIGEWLIDGSTLNFKPGKLIEAIEKNVEQLVIVNGPWHLLEFSMFWQQMLKTFVLDVYGCKFNIPSKFTIYKKDQQYNNILPKIQTQDIDLHNTKILPLNSTFFCNYFKTYESINGNLTTKKGWIEQNANNKLCLYSNEALDEHHLARLYDEARLHNTELQFIDTQSILGTNSDYVKAKIYVSNNIDVTVQTLLQSSEYEQAIVIDVSGITDNQLLDIINAKIDVGNKNFTIEQKQGIVIDYLMQNEKVILKGHFDSRLINNLSSFLIPNNEKSPHYKYVTNLTLVANSNEYLNKFSYIERYEKLEIKEEETYSNSETMDLNISADELVNKRLGAINSGFTNNKKYLVISGPTGGGKTEFVLKELPKHGYEIHADIKNIETWAKSTTENVKIALFIDEGNFGDEHSLSWIENLKQPQPFIIYKGVKINVTKQHVVIIACNLANQLYGGERVIPYIFRDLNMIVFNPLSLDFIEKNILAPARLNKKDIKILLNIYKYVCELSKDYIALTPRELRLIIDFVKNSKYSLTTSAYIVIERALQDEHKSTFIDWFKKIYGETFIPNRTLESTYNFVVTPSRLPAATLLMDFLDSRKKRTVGGLGGMLFSGECCGKTALIMHAFNSLGYLEVNINENTSNTNVFIKLSPQIPHSQKIDILKTAFNKGWVVLIEDINNYSMLEPIFNKLLIGLDLENKEAEVPGFSIICTTNPIIHTPLSLAILRRIIKIELPNYTFGEMEHILQFKGLNNNDAEKLLKDLTLAIDYSKRHNHVQPNLRHLMSAVDKYDPLTIQSSSSKRIKEDYIVPTITTRSRNVLFGKNGPSAQEILQEQYARNNTSSTPHETKKQTSSRHVPR